MAKSKGRARAGKSVDADAETSEESGSKDSGMSKKGRGSKKDAPPENTLVEWAKSIVIAVLLFVFLRSFLLQTFVITSGSMEETLLVGDMLLVNRASIGSRIPLTSVRIPGYSTPKRLDVLVFDPPHEETLKLVKRLVGMPGDTLRMSDRVLYVNGVAVDEPYLKHSDVSDEMHPWMEWQRDFLLPDADPQTYAPTRDNWGPLVIPEDRYFMMGDNRETSLDSRYWGLLEGWRFEGRAVFTYFSYNKGSYRPFPWIREIRAGRIGRAIR
jgi:signal peptidase I